jgi:hypothetical protein
MHKILVIGLYFPLDALHGTIISLLPYHLHVPIVLKSGSLNLVEPSWPVQVCNGNCFIFVIHSYEIFIHSNS